MARDVSSRPPLLAALLLKMVANRGDRRFVLDDLAEEFARISMEQGRAAARAWYWRHGGI